MVNRKIKIFCKSINNKIEKLVIIIKPAIIYALAGYLFKVTFVFVTLYIINYYTHMNISSCESLLQVNGNNWSEVLFKVGLGLVGVTIFSYNIKPICGVWTKVFDVLTGRDILKAQQKENLEALLDLKKFIKDLKEQSLVNSEKLDNIEGRDTVATVYEALNGINKENNIVLAQGFVMASNTLHAKTHETLLRTTELNINSGLTSTAHLSEQATQNTNRLVELL